MTLRGFRLAIVLTLAAVSTAACGVSMPQAKGVSAAGLQAAAKRKPKIHQPGELSLTVLPEAQDGLVLKALAGARKVIRLQMYLLTHQGVMDALIAAKARGVDVQVLLEPKPFNPGNPSQPLPTNKKAAEYLAKGGVVVGWTSDTYNFTHAKAMTIDDAVTYVSTANFTKSGLGVGGKGAREYIVADRSPSDVAEFVKMFQADWAHETYNPVDPDLVVSPTNARTKIFGLVQSAKRDILLGVEVAADPAFSELIAQKIKEGVRVRALLGDHNKINTNLATAKIWRDSGADVRFQANPFLHAKSIIVDEQNMYLGSINLTSNSMDNNRELGLMVSEAGMVKAVQQTMLSDWARASVRPRYMDELSFSEREALL